MQAAGSATPGVEGGDLRTVERALGQAVLLDLHARRLGELVEALEVPRHHVARQLGLEPRVQLLELQVPLQDDVELDLVLAELPRHPVRRGLDHALVAHRDKLELHRRDVLAATGVRAPPRPFEGTRASSAEEAGAPGGDINPPETPARASRGLVVAAAHSLRNRRPET